MGDLACLLGKAWYVYIMSIDNLGTQKEVELEAFRLPLAAAVASKLGVFTFEPMGEEDLRAVIKSKDPETELLMDKYFSLFLECGRSWTQSLSEARDAARLKLVSHTDKFSTSN